jgi:hypothetical protein
MVLLLAFPARGLAQSPGDMADVKCPAPSQAPNQRFCSKHAKTEIAAFCEPLAELLSYANANPGADRQCFQPILNKLNLADPRSVVKFISATATTFAAKNAIAGALRDSGQARPDQQLGAVGSTSLVARPGSAELLSLALDAGVLSQSVNGATATLSANADQIFRVLTKNDPDCTVNCTGMGWMESHILDHTNLAAGFALVQQSSTVAPGTGIASGAAPQAVKDVVLPAGAGRLSCFTVRYQLLNRFDPRSESFKNAWSSHVTSLAQNVNNIGDDTDAVLAALAKHKEFSSADNSQDRTDRLLAAALADPGGNQLIAAFESLWKDLTAEALRDPSLAAAVSKVMQDRAIYHNAWRQALEDAVGTLLTFEYSYRLPVNQPATHDMKVVYAYNFGNMGMGTLNGGVSFYANAIPSGANYGRFHAGSIGGEYDQSISSRFSAVQTQLSLAGYWQYQPKPSVLNIPAGSVLPGTSIALPNGIQEFVGTAGSLWVTQAKITIKGAGGINVPIGVSWANKTDLLQGKKVGAQIGISYNFASLAGIFSGSSGQ